MNNLYATNNFNMDAADTIFFENQLQVMKNKIYEPENIIRKASQLIPTSYNTPAGAEVVAYRTMEGSQNGKVIANYATDFPTVSISGKLYTNPIVAYGNSFLITVQDIRAARLGNIDLSARLAKKALDSHLDWMNEVAFKGDPIAGLPGWVTNTLIPTAPVAGDTTEQKTWLWKSTNDPSKIVTDIMEIIAAPTLATRGNSKVDTVVMPMEQFLLIQGLRLGNTSDTTVLDYVTETSKAFNNSGVKFEWANELDGAFGGLDGMIAYRNNIDDFWQELPLQPTLYPPQQVKLTFENYMESRHGGTVVVEPKHQAIRTGI